MSLDELAAFVVFSECLNFTRAAERLEISQPALHVKIKKLGEELRVPLYVKDRRRLYLTRQGEEVARFGRQSLAASEDFLSALRGGTPSRSVSLMAGAGSYLYLLGEAIGAFRAQRSCPLRLLTGDREATMAALRTGRAQLGVTVLRTVPEDVKADMVCRVPAMVVVARGHRLTRRRSVSLRDLDGESLIVPPPKAPFRETLETYLSQHKVSWKVGVEAGGWELMMRFVEWGLGITVVNGCCQAPAGCRAIPLKDLPTVDYYVLSARASRLDENAEALRAAILRRGFLSPC